MARAAYIRIIVEGPGDETIARRILRFVDETVAFTVDSCGGKPSIRRRIDIFNRAAAHIPHLVLVDLDQSHSCPAELIRAWLPETNPGLCMRVAVPQIESWLLADREGMAQYLSVAKELIPTDPDKLANAKNAMIRLAARSRQRRIRQDMVAPDGGRGGAYTSRIMEFASGQWEVGRAAENSESLRRSLTAIRKLLHSPA